MVKVCPICSEEFEHKQRVYCSPSCSKKAGLEREKERRRLKIGQFAEKKYDRESNIEVQRITELAGKEKLSYGQWVNKHESTKNRKEVKPAHRIQDDSPCNKCRDATCNSVNCNRWARWFSKEWVRLQKKAGVWRAKTKVCA